jgi:xylulokinase
LLPEVRVGADDERFIGVDVGTSGVKAAVVDRDGRTAATFRADCAVSRGSDGAVTVDARQWVVAVLTVLRQCASVVGQRSDVAGVAVTAPAHYAVLVDATFEPLSPVLIASDRRPDAVVARLRERYGPGYFDLTWCQLGPAWTAAQVAWHRQEHTVADWSAVAHVLLPKDYVRAVLVGHAATDPSDAAGTGLYNQARRRWEPDLAREAGLAGSALPPVMAATARAGGLTTTCAAQTGLLAGTPIYVGATDTAAELVAAHATGRGDGLAKIASTGTVVVVDDMPHPDPVLLTYPHAATDRWYHVGVTNTAGTAYRWLSGLTGSSTAGTHTALRDGLVFMPFLEGERTPYWRADLRGAFLGLSSGHGRDELARAVMDGVCLSLRIAADTLERAGAGRPLNPWFTGGGSANPLWRGLLAAALGTDGRWSAAAEPARGAALLASAGHRADPGLATLAAPTDIEGVVADPKLARLYDRFLPVYTAAAEWLLSWSALTEDAVENS